MTATATERYLVHGPRFQDLTDLLYFDKVVYPTTLAYIRPVGTPSGQVGYKLPEAIDRHVQEMLSDAGLLVKPGSLLPKIDFLNATGEEIAQWRTEMMHMNDSALRVLNLPADIREHEGATTLFLKEIDQSSRYLAGLAARHGKRTITKLYADSSQGVFDQGRTPVLSVIFSQLPRIDSATVDIKALIEFLADEETKKKRRRLFDWQNGIEMEVEKGNLKIEHVADRLATLVDDYTTWLKGSRLAKKMGAGEFLLTLSEALIEGLTLVGIPKAIKTLLEIGKRDLDLEKEELSAPGRELAYIAHCAREFKI